MLAGIPLAYIFIKPRRPEYYGLLPDGAQVTPGTGETEMSITEQGAGYATSFEEMDYTFKQAIKTGTYWLLAFGFSVHNIIASGFNLHVHPFLTDAGIDDVMAGSLMGMMIFFSAPPGFLEALLPTVFPRNKYTFYWWGRSFCMSSASVLF
jgi:hypothetical protein